MKRGMGKGAYLGGDGDGRVDGVGDDAEHGLGARLGARSDEVAHDRAVGVEEIVTGHAGLARHASGDHHNLFSPNTVRMVGQRAAMALLSFGLGGLAAGPHKASRGKSARVGRRHWTLPSTSIAFLPPEFACSDTRSSLATPSVAAAQRALFRCLSRP